MDEKKRPRAENILFVGEQAASVASFAGSMIPTAFTAIFCFFLVLAVLAGRLPSVFIGAYLTISILAFIAYALDKLAAKNGRWRTPESTLHFWTLAGGWPGALLAQKILRHKSKKKGFQTVFWITVVVNCAALVWFVIKDDSVF